ncbi:hypothetical protein QQ045_021786 [Rhodiola kirilowii]
MGDLITKYDLRANKWLTDMYALRSLWILVCFRDVHMGALLRTTSRSESENSFFGSAMDLQRQNRVQQNRESRSYVPTLNFTQKLEKHVSKTFSYPVFKKIQSEMFDSAYGCAIQSINEDEIGRIYIINDAGRNSKLFQKKNPKNRNPPQINPNRVKANTMNRHKRARRLPNITERIRCGDEPKSSENVRSDVLVEDVLADVLKDVFSPDVLA